MTSSATEPLPILVVDDDDQMLRTIGDILRFKGYAPLGAPTGREGLELATRMSLPPAVALVDLRLPDMDGIEVVSRLRGVSALTEVLILTGNASLDSAVRAMREQSYDYLVKPVAPDRLVSTIDRAAERWRRKSAEAAMRESQERLRRVFDHVRDALFITDAHGDILDANPAACALGGRPLEDLRGSPLDAVLGAPVLGAGDAMPDEAEYRVPGPGRSTRILEVRSNTFAPGMSVHTVHDLSERRRLEEELHQSRKMDAIGRLAGGVAHDINNVLTAITCYSEMLLADLPGADARREDVLEIRHAAQRAAGLTGQLLAFSRKQILQPRLIDLNIVVGDMERMLTRMIGEDITLALSLAPDLWLVRADPGQLEQVVMNLAVNARDAMPRGGRIEIATANLSLERPYVHRQGVVEPGDYVSLRVSDCGGGIHEDIMPHLFEPFFTTKGQGKGTGLGLSTVYGIITQSNGKIEVTSEPGAGAAFTMYLPRADGEEHETARTDAGVRGAGHGSETILVAEDDDALRNLLTRLLSQHGYRVLAASGAAEAVALAERHAGEVHLLLTDVVMPGGSGRELAERLWEVLPGLRVLYMSGYTDDVLVHRGVSDAVHTVLQKPFTTEALVRTLREALDAAPRG
ncbi:MAG TPA: response regulator [Gemmatimonadaceae bacterium]|nr:response regulator [Gemmatimonadaceae bacterium]